MFLFFKKIVKNSWKWFFHLNECLLTYKCSENAFLKYTLCILSLDLTFDQLVTQCQTTMFKYYESRPEVPLYDPAVMRDFCQKSAPELFDLLLKSITNEMTTEYCLMGSSCKGKEEFHCYTFYHTSGLKFKI